MRSLIAPALALLATAQAFAGEPPCPREGDRWLLSVRGPSSGTRAGFARIRGEPDARGGWAVHVICGSVHIKSGQETVKLRADGVAARARAGWLGGTYASPNSATGTHGFTLLAQDGLDGVVDMPPPCPTGRGDLSSGD